VGHIDTSSLPTPTQTNNGSNANNSNVGIPAATQAKISNTLPRLNTRRVQSISLTTGNQSIIALDLDSEGVLFGSGSTINPAALHFNPNHNAYDSATSPFDTVFPNISGTMGMDSEDSYEWMNMLGSGVLSTEDTFDSSSPSAISTTSMGAFGEFQEPGVWWNNTPSLPQTDYTPPQFTTSPPPPGTISPKDLQAQGQYQEHYYPSLIGQSYPATDNMIYNIGEPYSPAMQQDFGIQSYAYSSINLSPALSSITDSLRSSLLNTLSRPSLAFGGQSVYGTHQRRYSTAQSPPLGATKTYFPNLPSTTDLQKYVAAYFKFYHPHLPFLHVPTLSFNSTINTYKQEEQYISGEYVGGSECLLLSLAAIGALYDAEYSIAKEIFEAAKRMIHISHENHRKASIGVAAAAAHGGSQESINATPLFLVQSMLLNVIFGLNSGENIVSDIALSHCTAVVNLARSAGLCKAPAGERRNRESLVSSEMNGLKSLSLSDAWGEPLKTETENSDHEWFSWIVDEERKRTLYAVHKLSSMLCIAYNHTPALTNSEIRLHLPCDEDLWQAESSAAWNARGGAETAAKSAVLFSSALNALLSAGEINQAGNQLNNSTFDGGNYSTNTQPQVGQPQSKPNQFGALSLILALHVYIWETRRLSHARQWSSSEIEAIHAHIEPALRAWEDTWGSSSQQSMDRQNFFGTGPVSSDNTPLLDLAYIRLFVDLGRSRACLFSRDFQGMVDGLNKSWNDQPSGSSSSPSTNSDLTDTPQSATSPASSPTSTVDSPNLPPLKVPSMNNSMHQHFGALSSRHEKHLRRAAFYAADALALSEKSGVSCGSFGIKELPMQSLVCAFDSAQVLAEWVNAVQERIRPFMGSLDDPSCNLTSIEGLMMLENEDRILLERVFEVLRGAEESMVMEWGEILENPGDVCLSAKVLKISAYMLEKAAVWPGSYLPYLFVCSLLLTMYSYQYSCFCSPIPC